MKKKLKLPPNGRIIYQGPSCIPGIPSTERVVGIITFKSRNKKTGNLFTLWILPEVALFKSSEKGSLLSLIRSGGDKASCSGCIHSSENEKDCYVWGGLNKGPARMVESLQRRIALNGNDIFLSVAELKELFALGEYSIRLGGYGDPVALPLELLEELVGMASAHLGYTHMWATIPKEVRSRYSAILMASVDTPIQRAMANAYGWRTFRVKQKTEPKLKGEFTCPASKEGGFKTTCNDCLLCCGNSVIANDTVIDEHGVFSNAKNNRQKELVAA